MADPRPDEDSMTIAERVSARLGWIVGIVGLIAWVAMLWFMFGDVL